MPPRGIRPGEATRELPGQHCGQPGSISKGDSRVPLASVKKRALLTLTSSRRHASARLLRTPQEAHGDAAARPSLRGQTGRGSPARACSATSRGQQGARVDPKYELMGKNHNVDAKLSRTSREGDYPPCGSKRRFSWGRCGKRSLLEAL